MIGENSDNELAFEAMEAAAAAAMTAEINALKAERDDYKARMLTVAADFENYRKRSRKELAATLTNGQVMVLKDVLDVADNLEQALLHENEIPQSLNEQTTSDAVFQGVKLVLRRLHKLFDQYGIKSFESVGRPFDPKIHLAISYVNHETVPTNSVIAEHQRGYNMLDVLLRPASVAVSSGPSPLSEFVQASYDRYTRDLGLTPEHARQLVKSEEVIAYFDAVLAKVSNAKRAANWMIGEVLPRIGDVTAILSNVAFPLPPSSLAELVNIIESGAMGFGVTSAFFISVFTKMWNEQKTAREVIQDSQRDFKLS